MRRVLAGMIAVSCAGMLPGQEETPVKSSIVSLGLFKNGLAVVKREVNVSGPGTYVLADVPEPVHGTWWVQSDAPVETRVALRESSAGLRGAGRLVSRWRATPDFEAALIGKQVTINFGDAKIPPVSGKAEAVLPKIEPVWNRTYQRQQPRYWEYWSGYSPVQSQQAPDRLLVVQTEKERVSVDASLISFLTAEGPDEGVKQRLPALLITLKEGQKPGKVLVSYLTQGLAWAPSYRVDITDPKTLALEQAAAIKNELEDLDGVEMQLISGFPSIKFAHVTSPLSMGTNWAAFFQQLNQRYDADSGVTGQVMYQAAVTANAALPGVNLSAAPAGEGVDLHYQAIGPRTLKEGESISLTVSREKAAYERIVEWMIPDTRNEHGHYVEEYQRQREPDKYRDEAWDAVRFKNPLKFPMTTGPSLVVSGDQFNGQQMCFWANIGEETCLRVTKALSVRTRHVEQEEEAKRDQVNIGGRRYYRAHVKGELTLNNHRKEEVKVLARRRFSGELLQADGEPAKSLREEGVYSVNARNELLWTVTLKAGEEKTFGYRYSVLVSN